MAGGGTIQNPINTLGTFRTFWTGWLNRPDMTQPLADTIMNRAIARIERDCRLPCMEKTQVAVPDGQGFLSSIAIPQDFLEVRWIEGDNQVLRPIDINALLRMSPPPSGNTSGSIGLSRGVYPAGSVPFPGTPQVYTRVQGNMILRPCPQNYATMYYYGQFDPLNADTDTNALFQVAPELLLWACMSYAGDYYRMDETQTWDQRFQAEKVAVTQLALDADYGGGPQAVQTAYGGYYL